VSDHAEIIAIGSELTSGASLDTNSQWISRRLADAGIPVTRHTAVADDLEDMLAVFRDAAARSDVLIITGGLGPTLDDLTRQALAGLAGVELVLHEPALEHLRNFFASRRRAMPERNMIQAMFPAGSEPIANARGTAPGIWLEYRAAGREAPCRIAALPGVPSEMKPMFDALVLPRLSRGGRTIVRHEVHCFGAGESAIEEILGDLTARGRTPEVGITAHEATITLRIWSAAATVDDGRRQVDATVNLIRERLGSLVFGENGERLEQVVLRMLVERGLTLATAEIGTGGLLAQWLTDASRSPTLSAARPVAAPGRDLSSEEHGSTYRGGCVLPPAVALSREFDQAPPTSDEPEAVRQLGAALAGSCRQEFSADFGLAVSGWTEPAPADARGPVPSAWVALAGGETLKTEEHTLLGDPAISRSRLAKAALNLLRMHLLKS
jgi:nicotinamide-nucleotide amidase